MQTELKTRSEFTAADRCDRCGAQAYVRVELAGGGKLYFCAHHGAQFSDKLHEVAVTIHDESALIG